ncbi:PREDICTED: glutathione S-transferase 1, isoform C-like [Priapulus caudatus]|uniref:Glutathione S-transferase 1, isoform C-like n=1 Tax=Priapulus caudatus TaxID=37621 RepID=A0ABM1DU00_PRICU|nr:PREDICTED: glutathione S-transferase 1, isoform C-like [Priapulus caudatus]
MSRPVDIYRTANVRNGIQGTARAYRSPASSPSENDVIKIYYHPISPPSRNVMMVAKELGVPHELRHVDLFKGEHKTEEFLRINPFGTLPSLVDEGFIVCESRAIVTYLANRYGKDDNLYPKDPRQRTRVDSALQFDVADLWPAIKALQKPQLFGKTPAADAEEAVLAQLRHVDRMLSERKYLVSDHVTLADICVLSSVTFLECFGNFSIDQFENVSLWVDQLKRELRCYDVVNEGFELWKADNRKRQE